MNFDGLLTDELDFKFNSGLLNFEKMSDAWTAHRELVLIHKTSGDPLKKPFKITDYNWDFLKKYEDDYSTIFILKSFHDSNLPRP